MSTAVQDHYSSGHLHDTVMAGLVAAGLDPDDLQPEDLAAFEEFHTFGPLATIALADAAEVTADDQVLDVGSGLGGPARALARRFGCHVTGIDVTPELCDLGIDLTRRVGLEDRVTLSHGDALDLPFADDSFDLVWTQHASMNIADKAGLYASMRRVARTGGRLASFDILAGGNAPIHFPVPWAEEPDVSHLATEDETRGHLADAGFTVRVWDDVTVEAGQFYAALGDISLPPKPLGLHLFVANLPTKGANLVRNVDEDRIAVVRCVADAT